MSISRRAPVMIRIAKCRRRDRWGHEFHPFAGMIRIRFEGSPRCMLREAAANGLSAPCRDSPWTHAHRPPAGRCCQGSGAAVVCRADVDGDGSTAGDKVLSSTSSRTGRGHDAGPLGKRTMSAGMRAVRRAVLAMLFTALTGCGYDVETLQRVLVLQDRDLTAAGPSRTQPVDAHIAAIGLPLGTSSDRRLCGGMVGNTRLSDKEYREAIRSSAEKFTDSNFSLTYSGTGGGTLERQLFQASAR